MVGSYRISTGWTILGLIVQPLFFIFCLAIALGALLSDDPMDTSGWVIAVIGLALAASLLYSIMDLITGKWVLTESAITQKNSVRTKILEYSNVKGYWIGPWGIVLYPANGGKQIRISHYVKEYDQFVHWTESHFSHLGKVKE